MSDGPDPLTPEQRQKKREELLEMDYADTCDNCDEIYFEWQDECRYCESADGVEETSEQQTLLTDGGTSASGTYQTPVSGLDEELVEECEICGGIVDAGAPGHWKSPDERFRHKVCHVTGEPPSGYVRDLSSEHPEMCSVNRQYNCGHTVYGPPKYLPHECPECGKCGLSTGDSDE